MHAEPEKYIEEFTQVRGLAIFLAVLGNSITTVPVDMKSVWWMGLLHNYIYSFHMHLFFVVSGCCFGLARQRSYGELAARKTKRLMLPYLLFSLLFLGRYLIFDPYQTMPELRAYIGQILIKGGEYWFIFVLFFFFVLCQIFIFLAGKIGKLPTLLTLLVWAYVCRTVFSNPVITHDVFYFLIYLTYFLAGYFFTPYLSDRIQNKERLKILVLGGIFVLFCLLGRQDIRSLDVPFLVVAFAPVAGVVLSISLVQMLADKPVGNILSWLGKWSLQIYLVEAFVAVFVMYLLHDLLHLQYFLILFVLFFVIKVVLCFLLLQFGVGRFAVVLKLCGGKSLGRATV